MTQTHKMKRIFIFLIFIPAYFYAKTVQKHWIVVICNTKSLENANAFIKKFIPKHKKDIFIIKGKKYYITAYGAYATKKEALIAKKNLPKSIRNIGAYTIKIKYNLANPTKYKKKIKIKKANIKKIKPRVKLIYLKRDNINKNINKYDLDLIIGLKYSFIKETGDFKFGKNGTYNDFKYLKISDLDQISPLVELNILKKHKFLATYFQKNIKKTKFIEKKMILDNYTYSPNQNIKISEKTKWLIFGYKYRLNNISLGANIHSLKRDFEISNNFNKTYINLDYYFLAILLNLDNKIYNYDLDYGISYGKNSKIFYLNSYVLLNFYNFFIGYEINKLNIQDDLFEQNTKYKHLNFGFKIAF